MADQLTNPLDDNGSVVTNESKQNGSGSNFSSDNSSGVKHELSDSFGDSNDQQPQAQPEDKSNDSTPKIEFRLIEECYKAITTYINATAKEKNLGENYWEDLCKQNTAANSVKVLYHNIRYDYLPKNAQDIESEKVEVTVANGFYLSVRSLMQESCFTADWAEKTKESFRLLAAAINKSFIKPKINVNQGDGASRFWGFWKRSPTAAPQQSNNLSSLGQGGASRESLGSNDVSNLGSASTFNSAFNDSSASNLIGNSDPKMSASELNQHIIGEFNKHNKQTQEESGKKYSKTEVALGTVGVTLAAMATSFSCSLVGTAIYDLRYGTDAYRSVSEFFVNKHIWDAGSASERLMTPEGIYGSVAVGVVLILAATLAIWAWRERSPAAKPSQDNDSAQSTENDSPPEDFFGNIPPQVNLILREPDFNVSGSFPDTDSSNDGYRISPTGN